MDRDWSRGELAEHWSLGFEELGRIEGKSESLRLGFAAQIKFYQIVGRFPHSAQQIPRPARDYLCDQLGRPVAELFDYDWTGRNGQRHRAEILSILGVQVFEASDLDALEVWLEATVCPSGASLEAAIEAICRWCQEHKVEPPSQSTSQRLIRSVRRRFEESFHLTSTISTMVMKQGRLDR
jgi:hypothetical protein